MGPRVLSVVLLLAGVSGSRPAIAQTVAAAAADTTVAASKLFSPDDGWLDLSGFLDARYGFLPMATLITEPAVGFGLGGGVAFMDKPLGAARAGFGRPNITFVGGLGTENGTRGAGAGDVRYWLDDRLQTLAGIVYASVNLDYYGTGEDAALDRDPLRYNLEPRGGMLQGKYRLGSSRFWAGLGYAFTLTEVTFEAPAGAPGIPEHRSEANVAGVTPALSFDSRDNIFTPLSGTYVEAMDGLFGEAVGGDDDFQRAQVIAMQFVPLRPRLFLGLRGDAKASFGDAPFYMLPFVSLRGAPFMRYQGEVVAQLEAELRWQCWNRFSLVGFKGWGATRNDFERIEGTRTVETGGVGFRYELARRYGIHWGVDLAFGPDNTAVYFQTGSAWARP